ncbi:MAG: helix-turn-helix transcriptional regulator, partial [Oscillospiraceae bacterium]|nr:helix-turn-helix transcriptional regulator [Oscillospiraceae bacterium]
MNRPERIREARERQGMTQETLAEEIGVSRQAVSKWEMGISEPSLENLQALSQILGIGLTAGAEAVPAGTGKNPWRALSLVLGCLLLAALLALGAALLPGETPAEDTGAPSATQTAWSAPDQDTPSVTGIAFFDAGGRPLRPDLGDGWLYFEAGSQVLMTVSFQDKTTDTVNAVSLFVTPAGSETLSQREQLAVQAVDSGRTIALFPLDMSQDVMGHLDITLECSGAQNITETLNITTM